MFHVGTPLYAFVMRTLPTVMAALVTPFDGGGEIDEDAHRHNLSLLRERGIEGFVLGGSTGEGPYLEPGERRRLLDVARDEVGDDAFLVSGVAAESLRAGLAQAEEATAGGADALLVMTPTTLIRGNARAVARYYEALAASSELPVLLYSVPGVTGFELPAETAAELAGRPGIVGMKDSGGQPVRVQQIMATAPVDFRLFIGSSPAVALGVAGGAHGAITASANYAPRLVIEVVAAARKSVAKAADAQERLAGLSRLVDARGVAAVKLAAEVSGLRPGRTREPLQPLSGADADVVRRRLEALRGQLLG